MCQEEELVAVASRDNGAKWLLWVHDEKMSREEGAHYSGMGWDGRERGKEGGKDGGMEE